MSSQAGVLPPGVAAGSLGKRFVAYLIDNLVPGVLGGLVGGLVAARVVTDTTVLLVLSIAVGVVGLGWLVLCWWMLATKGATPGMKLMKLQFVSLRNGKPVGWGPAILRQIVLGVLSGSGVGAVVVLITILTDVRNQGLHDKAGKGVVIKERARGARVGSSSVAVEAPVSQAPSGAAPVGLPAHLQANAGFAPGQNWDDSGFAPPQSSSSAPEFGGGFAPSGGGFPQSQSSAPGGHFPPQQAAPQSAQSAPQGMPQSAQSAPQGMPQSAQSAPQGVPQSAQSQPSAPGAYPQSQPSAPGAQPWNQSAQPWGSGQPGQAPGAPGAPGGQPQPWGGAPQAPSGQGGPITSVPFQTGEPASAQSAPRPAGAPDQFGPGQVPGQPMPGQPGQPAGPEPTVPIDLAGGPAPAFGSPGRPEDRELYGRPPGMEEPTSEPDDGTRMISRAGGRAPDQGWTIALDDGRYIKVESLVLIGRNPQPRAGEEHAELVRVGEAARTVSKTHLAVGVDNRGIYVTDRGSTNGSAIANAGGDYEPCAPGEVVRVREGQIVSFGEHRLEIQRAFS
ncbi:RDD family protein [Enemella sp. A6]|uniref:RDD family protein n=1 Tax=Enemella sp. A6 TaxID=3440152 RepID=UPI003EB7FB92